MTEDLNLTEIPAKASRGGARAGAGRKPKGTVAASKVMRVPEQYEACLLYTSDAADE